MRIRIRDPVSFWPWIWDGKIRIWDPQHWCLCFMSAILDNDWQNLRPWTIHAPSGLLPLDLTFLGVSPPLRLPAGHVAHILGGGGGQHGVGGRQVNEQVSRQEYIAVGRYGSPRWYELGVLTRVRTQGEIDGGWSLDVAKDPEYPFVNRFSMILHQGRGKCSGSAMN